jgi:DNA-directed RNA polymerase specialized sigma24 family protein
MPRVARFKIAAIGDLCRQLMYAPAEASRRQLDAAERLVAQIEPGQVYPQEFVIFRITAYRSDRTESPTALVGEALVGDLVTLIQRLSHSLDIASDDAGRTAVSLEVLARRLKVSAKTLQRYRQQGLVCHYMVFPDGAKRLACFEDAVDRFVSRNRGRLDRAATFSRVDDAVQQTIISEAREQHEARGLSLNAVAKHLAEKYGRAHETLRSILRRHDRAAANPIFSEPGPLRERDVRLIHRAVRFGVSAPTLARHFGKTPATIHRAVNRRRRELLEELDLSFVTLAPMDEDDAEAAVLGEPAVTANLGPMLPQHDALALIEATRAVTPLDERREHALACAFNLLKRRAGRSIEGLPQDPGARELDRVETDLRWAPMIGRRLVELGLPGAVAAIEHDLGRGLSRQPSDEIVDLLRLAVDVVGRTVAVLDPAHRRLARATGEAMSRALGQRQRRARAGRAATRHRPGSVMLVGAFERLCPWQAWLGLRPDLHEAVAGLDAGQRRLVELRYGLGGDKPLTFVELADLTGATPSNVARRIARAEATLRQIRRSVI